MRYFYLLITSVTLFVSVYSYPGRLFLQNNQLLNTSPDLRHAYLKYAPIIKEEIQAMRERMNNRSEDHSETEHEDTAYSITDFIDFEKNLPNGKPYYVGEAVLNELTPTAVIPSLGKKINQWLPNNQNYMKFIEELLETDPLISFKISETNLFEGLNVIKGER
ncbi:uncharacterized protein Ecym_4507 [Eremothecium cymbalariae DBVPG|uniref:Uncharacterized protein n=1 Tax=Eremothecium cymbalariae (strain CBS 270.75 / DBVPG 7215 / KCTC 17166 / NRRL Y-17582) TaxID=931890 RepID=G8JU41_ERECY|nr:hypothetical protein Ecym_4507 [Eremothecium cymbalariae DBVPG\